MDARPAFRDRLAAGQRRPLIVAHRGIWDAAPENSCAAIATAQAFDMVEIDIRLAADGVPVLMHDPTLARMTGQAAAPGTLTAADLAALRLRQGAGGPDSPVTEARVPTLAEALAAGGDALLYDIDVKDGDQLGAVAAWLSRHDRRTLCMLKRDVAGPEDIEALCALERAHGIAVIAKILLRSRADLDLVARAKAAGVAGAEIWFSDLALLQAAARTGLFVSTYTLDDVHCAGLSDSRAVADPAAVWGRLCNAGVGAIMTDRAPLLAGFLSGRTARG